MLSRGQIIVHSSSQHEGPQPSSQHKGPQPSSQHKGPQSFIHWSCTGTHSCINQRTTRWSDRRKACGKEARPEAQRGSTQTPSTGPCDILSPTTAIAGYAIVLRQRTVCFSLVFKWQYVCNRLLQSTNTKRFKRTLMYFNTLICFWTLAVILFQIILYFIFTTKYVVSGDSFQPLTMFTPIQIKPKSFESSQN